MSNLAQARSFLFVPGDRPERFAKAISSGADAVILDLEDAVAPTDKPAARRNIRALLDGHPQARLLVRINDGAHPEFAEDLMLARHPALQGVILPKATHAGMSGIAAELPHPVWPLIETARGVSEVSAMARGARGGRLMLGTLDLSLDLGLSIGHPGGGAMLDQARFRLVSAARRANAPPPVDGVFPALDDTAGLAACAAHAAATGMSGMMCIHPGQIEIIHTAFAPSPEQIEWATAVLAASLAERHSFRFRGQMIDAPVLSRARSVLANARA